MCKVPSDGRWRVKYPTLSCEASGYLRTPGPNVTYRLEGGSSRRGTLKYRLLYLGGQMLLGLYYLHAPVCAPAPRLGSSYGARAHRLCLALTLVTIAPARLDRVPTSSCYRTRPVLKRRRGQLEAMSCTRSVHLTSRSLGLWG